ncbi:MAG TPA: M56 family metallopeptidase, partial [Caulobacterales bacterium]|nr:M56 family metallopeptidase [Caulobacterales bacterium]
MASELIETGIRFNLILAASILVVLVLRAPMRRLFGARIAYALWLMPPLAAAMCFAPRRIEIIRLPAQPLAQIAPSAPALDPTPWIAGAWVAGALVFLAVLALRQHRFVRSLGRLVRRGERVFGAQSQTGPAVVGALWPKIVTPADFEHRYSEEERAVVLAHERAHMRQGDPLINALAALMQCVNWFNPLVHIGVRALRVDQELACDAAVMARVGQPRRIYAEAMLKAHAAPLGPLVCAWPAPSLNPLKERIAMLKRTPPSRSHLLLGAAVVTIATFGVCTSAWTAQPARIVALQAQAEAPKGEDVRAEPTADVDLEVNPQADADIDLNVDTPEFQARVDELTEDAMRLAHEAFVSADANADHRPAMSPQQRAQLEREIRNNAWRIRRDSMQQARAAMVQARAEIELQRPVIDMQMREELARQRPEIDAQVRNDLRAQAEQLRAQARQFHAEQDHMSANERNQRQAALEAQAQEVAAHAVSIAQRALENALAGL